MVYIAAQIVLFDEARSLEWDEAEYIGKATDHFVSLPWSAHRALGIPWLLTPLFWVTKSLVAMRWYLAFTSALSLGLGFSTWTKPIGRLAALALLFFSSSWLALFYGSEASPNIYVAAFAVGAAGSFVQLMVTYTRWSLLLLAEFVALAAVFRPSDAIVLGAGLAIAGLLWRGATVWWKTAAAIVCGGFVGMVPWLWDSWANFGGPIHRWKAASRIVYSSLRWQVGTHLELMDGPLMGPDRAATVSRTFALIVVLVASLIILAVVLGLRRRESLFVSGLGLLLALPYLVYIGASAPRFLLPAQAMLSLGVIFGVAALHRRVNFLGALALVALIAGGAVGIARADSIEHQQFTGRAFVQDVAENIRELADGESCTVLSQYAFPQISLMSGCIGDRLEVERAGCQIAEWRDLDAVVLVSFVGDAPEGLAPGFLGPHLSGRNGWFTALIDPAQVTCDE